jgi:Mg/Co/Ni transporter MgtE
MRALAEKGGRAPVAEAMQSRFETADPTEMLESAFHRLQTCDCHALPVLRGEQLVGMLTMDNVGELMMVQAAVRGARQASRPSIAWRPTSE